MTKIKRRAGNTLIEVLMALCVLGIVVPASLGALGGVLLADVKINERARMVSSAEWWFGNLTFPVLPADINAAPRTDPHGKTSFDWKIEDLPDAGEAVRVTLTVYGRMSAPYTVSRIF